MGRVRDGVLFPSDLPYPDAAIVGPDTLHRVLRGWLAWLGHDAFAPDRPAGA